MKVSGLLNKTFERVEDDKLGKMEQFTKVTLETIVQRVRAVLFMQTVTLMLEIS